MEAIILVGGLGTRLRGTIGDIPKPMAQVEGRPFLSYLLDFLALYDVSRVLLSVGYKHEIISDFFGSKYSEIDIEYVVEDEPLGTGGAIRESLSHATDDDLLILNGDSFFNIDLLELMSTHFREDADVTLSLRHMKRFDRYGTVVIEDLRPTGFLEKRYTEAGYINAGVYAVKRSLSRLLDGYPRNFSFEADFLQNMQAPLTLAAYFAEGYFVDIGVPEDYKRAQMKLNSIFEEVMR